MGLFDRVSKKNDQLVKRAAYELVSEVGSGFLSWNGNIYKSDILRGAIRPKVQAIGKAVANHIQNSVDGNTGINSEPYMRMLLKEPNPIMTGQILQEKLAMQLELNSNAFALVDRDTNGLPVGIYPLNAQSYEALTDKSGNVYVRFFLKDGKPAIFHYSDLIHLRKDFGEGELFGEPIAPAIMPLLEIVTTQDQGLVKAIKNSNVIRWLLKYNQSLRKEDIESNTKEFVKSFLSSESESIGAAGVDSKAEAVQVKPTDYVPGDSQVEKSRQRIYSLLNTNDKIVQSTYNEDEWISYYESQIEPVLIQFSDQYSIKLLSRKKRMAGEVIIFESSSLTFASMKTKLNLVGAMDRGALSRNEFRRFLNLGPIEGGDKMILRKDTSELGKNGERKEEDE